MKLNTEMPLFGTKFGIHIVKLSIYPRINQELSRIIDNGKVSQMKEISFVSEPCAHG